MDTTDSLITRIAAGQGEDAEVLRALGWKQNDYVGSVYDGPNGERESLNQFAPLTSVDDALRLVPEGWHTAEVWEVPSGTPFRWKWRIVSYPEVLGWRSGTGPTAARALVIAILRTKENPDERR